MLLKFVSMYVCVCVRARACAYVILFVNIVQARAGGHDQTATPSQQISSSA